MSMSSDATKTGSSGNALGTATKTSVDVDAPGMLNGEVIYNIELDSLPEKPWRMPGIALLLWDCIQILCRC